MPQRVVIYHNPRCSKSRQTLELLRETDVEPEIVEYLKDTPTAEQLAEICTKLGCGPRDIVRWKEKRAKELELSEQSAMSDREWLQTLADNPVLIERPIVVSGKGAAIGRPPDRVLGIL